ncbi:MAG TPA: TolC family protein [Williamwhitmania sp.]|nr:TolC family protein [Williamwhitmania sp.]
MVKKTFFVLPMLITSIVTSAFSQSDSTAMALSLNKAIEYAESNNLLVKNSELDLAIAKKKIWETTASGLPQITGSGSYQHTFSVPTAIFPDFTDPSKTQAIKLGVANSTSWGVKVTQLVFSGEYIVGLRASKIYKELSDRNLTKTKNDIRESVTTGYYLVLIMEENLKIMKETQVVTNKNLGDIIALGDQGLVEETSVDQLRIIKANIDNAVANLERQSQWAKNLLKFQLGLDLSTNIELTDSLNDYIEEGKLTANLNLALNLKANPDYRVAVTAEKLQKLSLDRQKSLFLPTISAYYQHQKLLNTSSFNFQPEDVFGLSLDVPIFTSGMKLSQLSQARKQYQQSQNNTKMAEQNLMLSFENAQNNFKNSYSSYITTKANLALVKKILDHTMIKYKEGVTTSNDLYQAENQYLSTESDYFNAMNSLLTAKTTLEKLNNNQQ